MLLFNFVHLVHKVWANCTKCKFYIMLLFNCCVNKAFDILFDFRCRKVRKIYVILCACTSIKVPEI